MEAGTLEKFLYQPWRELGTHSTKAFALGLLRRKKV